MKFNSFIFLISLIMFAQSFAEEGGYLIKSTPTDVKIYIDDKLRAEQTPYSVILPEGKHIVRIEKKGKQTITKEILISNKGIIKDEFTLETRVRDNRTLISLKSMSYKFKIRI
jgi:hypothetical protein